MEKELRIICPGVDITKEQRVERLFSNISNWLFSSELSTLVELFGGKINKEMPLKEIIEYLNDFVEVWDYRKIQADGGERWNIYDDEFVERNSSNIMSVVEKLGLKDITEPIISPDYILPLGGARMTNLIRPQYARAIADSNSLSKHCVVALGGMRPINDIEKEAINTYAPNAVTEYDAICAGLEQAFSLDQGKYNEDSYENNNVNLSWAIRNYDGTDCYVVAAPSTSPSRRANSMDTFEFFLDKFDVKKGEKVLLVTSCIYVPFQFLKFMEIAIEKELVIDCVGTPYNSNNVLKPSNYLQEIKATINAIKSLSNIYL